MERAILNGEEILASEVAHNYYLEEKVRRVSGKELICPDEECEEPILVYKHGEKRRAHFAHKVNCSCDYARFDRNNEHLRSIRYKIYRLLKEKGYIVKIEQKILPHHYTHLVIEESNKIVAIEIGTKDTSEKVIHDLYSEYSANNIELNWIVVSDYLMPVKNEENLYWVKRWNLNRSDFHDLIEINLECSELSQSRMLTRFNGEGELESKIYCEKAKSSELILYNGSLAIEGFENRYNQKLDSYRRSKMPTDYNNSIKNINKDINTDIKTNINVNYLAKGVEKRNIGQNIDNLINKSIFEDDINEIFEQRKRQNDQSRTEKVNKTVQFFNKRSTDEQERILEFTKKISMIETFSFKEITNETPLNVQFETIFRLLPEDDKDRVISKYHLFF